MLAAETGIARAAPGEPDIRITISVDPDRAGLHLFGEALHAADVRAPDTGGEAVFRAIGLADGIGLVEEPDDADDGTEYLLLGDAHFVVDIGEHCGGDEIAVITDARAAGRHGGAFLGADIDIFQHTLHLQFGDDRSHRRAG